VKITGRQRQKLVQAIISAYPTKAALEMMINFTLEENLNVIAGGENYEQVVFQLIKWAKANGKLEILILSASEYNPGNKELQTIKNEINTKQTPIAPHYKPDPLTRKILILSANPRDTSKLSLDEEMREIKEGLKRGRARDKYSIETAGAVRYRDIHRYILDYEPNIVHFSGHGAEEEGLVFEDENGLVKLVDAEALAGLFELFAHEVECIVLNACYSKVQGEAIAKHINHVVGMSKAINDQAAIEFAVGFYDALGAGKSYAFAHRLGCQVIKMSGASEALIPCILGKSHPRKPSEPEPLIIENESENEGENKPLDDSQLTPFEFQLVQLNAQGQESGRRCIEAKRFCEEITEHTNLEMVAIPGGVFQMGSSELEEGSKKNEWPQHSVELSSFYISKFPITQAQWYRVSALPKVEITLNKVRSKFKGEELPMEGVSWYEALEFCARLSRHVGRQYRLPSEAEWEYACRAGTATRYHFGDRISTSFANYNGAKVDGFDSKEIDRKRTTPINSFGVSNAFGLSDMHGNVFEWCADPWHENYEGAPQDGSNWDMGGQSYRRVIRGGAYNEGPNDCRAASRYFLDPKRRTGFVVGFRVVF